MKRSWITFIDWKKFASICFTASNLNPSTFVKFKYHLPQSVHSFTTLGLEKSKSAPIK